MKNWTVDYVAEVSNLTLMDDVLMTAVFEEDNGELTAFILKIILNRELTVTSVKVQDTKTNLRGRSVRLDIHAISAEGEHFDIEIQRASSGATPERARYNSSLLDANLLATGEDFNALPETYVIFITESDVLKLGEPIYFIERRIVGTNKFFDDGTHIVYVNNSIRDDTPLGHLMHDFDCADPDKIFYKELADKIGPQKKEKEKVLKLAGVMERITEQARRETAVEKTIEFAKSLIAIGKLTLEEIASICKLPLEKVQALAAAK